MKKEEQPSRLNLQVNHHAKNPATENLETKATGVLWQDAQNELHKLKVQT